MAKRKRSSSNIGRKREETERVDKKSPNNFLVRCQKIQILNLDKLSIHVMSLNCLFFSTVT